MQVVALQLAGLGLSGSLPESLEALRQLQVLDVSQNPDLFNALPQRMPRTLRSVDISGTCRG